MFNFDQIVEEEFNKLIDDITAAYEQSGKKVSGEFETGLKVTSIGSSWILEGFGYLAGRIAGLAPPIADILRWVQARGLRPIIESQTQSQLAYAIATKIGQEGTNSQYHLKIYEQVVTPMRIQEILDRVVQLNVTAFVDAVSVELKLLTKDL
jgi:hypothetical protein